MAGLIPEQFIQDLLNRVDIAEVIGSRIELKKRGRDYLGLCPFHAEKTPSFNVVPGKQFYHCFGCQASGTVLKFLMEHDNMDFVQAVETLAASVGLEVPRATSPRQREAKKESNQLFATLAMAADFFADQLRSHAQRKRAVDYLKGRGLTGQLAKRYALGYAPGENCLLAGPGRDEQMRFSLLRAGLLVEKDGGGYHDRFRNRVIFPIRNRRGQVIAFGGRVLGDGKPKYLNSPASSVFEKSRELYGLYEAQQANRSLDRIILVEGYMDVIGLAQHGVPNAAATLGTAVSEQHVQRLFGLVDDLVFAFDGDEAGRNAGWKAARICLPMMTGGRTAKFLFLPEGEDPDSLIRREGLAAFQERLQQASGLADTVFDHLKGQILGGEGASGSLSLEQSGKLAHQAVQLMARVPEGPALALMKKRLQEVTGLDMGEIDGLLGGAEEALAAAPKMSAPPQSQEERRPPSFKVSSLAEKALRMLLKSPELAREFGPQTYQSLKADSGLLAEMAGQLLHMEDVQPLQLPNILQLDASWLDYLRDLGQKEWLLGPSDTKQEYRGTIERLLESIKKREEQEQRMALLRRGLKNLTEPEKAWLREKPASASSGSED